VRKLYGYGWGIPTLPYPELGADYDPQNPPANFSQLSRFDLSFYYTDESQLATASLPREYTLNPDSPFVPPHLRQPTSLSLRTFGHDYSISKESQRGGRYQYYSGPAVTLAVPCSIAVDRATGATFYTQSPRPTASEESLIDWSYDPPFSAFRPRSEPHYAKPESETGWIVMVY